MERPLNDQVQDTLNQIGRAMRRKTGAHLTAEQVAALSLTFLGETCLESDPRKSKGTRS